MWTETPSEKMIRIVTQLIALIRLTELEHTNLFWEQFFVAVLVNLKGPHDLKRVSEKIMSAFGGMGTLSDYWLERDGVVLDENKQFETLLNELCLACKANIPKVV